MVLKNLVKHCFLQTYKSYNESGFIITLILNKKCPVCGSNHIIKKGKRNGKQRFQCGDCQANFTIKNIGVKRKNQFIWFRKWIMERQVYKTLSRDSTMSQSTLQNLFKYYLSQAPTLSIKSKTKVHLLIDGTYFSNGLCLILYYAYDIRYVPNQQGKTS